jgi:DNA-binding transcriptional MocR family regulator
VSEQYQINGRSASEIATSVERGVASGALAAGASLPSVRVLARALDVSPTTVAAALADLRRRGVVVSRPRSGTRVAERPPLRRPVAAVPEDARDLASGSPDPALLPELVPLAAPQRLYGGDPVLPELAAVAAAAFTADGVPVTRIAAVNGALDGIERVLSAHLGPGDAVAVEDPGWPGVFDVVRMLGLRLVGVATDERGMLPDALAAVSVRAVILTPRGHNPCGNAFDAARARDLAAALPEDALVIEDDHLGPVAGTPYHTLTEHLSRRAGRSRWAAIRSVSKWLGPDLRLAVVTGDEETLTRVEGRQSLGPGWVSGLSQRLAAHLWADPSIATAAAVYTERRNTLADRLALPRPPSGINLWVPVPDEDAAVRSLLAEGWAVAPGRPYRLSGGSAIRITTAALDVSEAPALAAAVGRAVTPPRRTRAA